MLLEMVAANPFWWLI